MMSTMSSSEITIRELIGIVIGYIVCLDVLMVIVATRIAYSYHTGNKPICIVSFKPIYCLSPFISILWMVAESCITNRIAV